jgi:hypothetical protein
MPLLVRRINRAKWEQIKSEDYEDVSADAITNCLKTSNNELSVWKINNETELENAILALITGKSQEKLSTLHYVILNEEFVLQNGLELKNTSGDTAVETLKNTHSDISNLTYKKLGIVKTLILESIKSEQCSFFSKKQLKEIIQKALLHGIVDKELLNEKLVINEKL